MSRVVIVGAGPAGASLALLLARRGVQVSLVERRSDFSREFRGEILMPSGLDALDQMGVGDRVRALPGHAQRRIDVYLNRRHLFDADLEPESPDGVRVLAVSQPALLEMLVEEASRQPSFEFVRGAAARALVRNGDRVDGIRIREGDVERDLHADLVVGADGRNSIVRRQAGLEAVEASPPMDIVWCKLPCPAGWDGVRAYAGRGHLLIAYRTWGDMLQLGWVILKGTFGELRSRGIGQWVEEMANYVSDDFARHLRANLQAVERPFLLSAESDRVLRWSAPGLLVVGDAAHTMSPVGGQGINIALRDVVVAENFLAPVLTAPRLDPDALDAALEAIESARLPEVVEVQALQAAPPKLLLSRAWWGEPVRQVVGALLRLAPVRDRAMDRVGVFLNGVTDVHRRG